MERKRYDLVYQCGLANVFRCIVPPAGSSQSVQYTRIAQGTYGQCEWLVRGLLEAGAECAVWHSDVTGDVLLCPHGPWQMGAGDLWADKKDPPVECAYAA